MINPVVINANMPALKADARAPRFIINGLADKRFVMLCIVDGTDADADGIINLVSEKLLLMYSDFSATIRTNSIIASIVHLSVELVFDEIVWLNDLGIAIGAVFEEAANSLANSLANFTIRRLEIYNPIGQVYRFDPTCYDALVSLVAEKGVYTRHIKTTRRTEMVPVTFLGVTSDVATVKIDSEDILLA
jgi:hypothetical protein